MCIGILYTDDSHTTRSLQTESEPKSNPNSITSYVVYYNIA